MEMIPCSFCRRPIAIPDGDFAAFTAHVDACPAEMADVLVREHPEWNETLVEALHPRNKPFSKVSGRAGAADIASKTVDTEFGGLWTEPSASEVLPGVWLTDISRGMDPAWLREKGIRTVVNCIDRGESKPLFGDALEAASLLRYECLDMDDGWHEGYDARIRRGAAALAEGVAVGHSVLVHCAAGVSRSATVLIAYLMEHAHAHPAVVAARASGTEPPAGGHAAAEAGVGAAAGGAGAEAAAPARATFTFASALLLAKSRRRVIYPNLGFLSYLRALEEQLHAARAAAGEAVGPYVPSLPEDLLGITTQALAKKAAGAPPRR